MGLRKNHLLSAEPALGLRIAPLTLILTLSLFAFWPSLSLAQAGDTSEDPVPASSSGTPIYPVWKLLSFEQKANYLAGYVQGWKDASRVTDIAIEYVKQNPEEAVRGLEQLKGLYDLSDVSPSLMVSKIDSFLGEPSNRSAPLSLAISTARNSSPEQ